MAARVHGDRISLRLPAFTARPAGEPCDVRITNRISFSASTPLAADCRLVASVLRVASARVLVLARTLTRFLAIIADLSIRVLGREATLAPPPCGRARGATMGEGVPCAPAAAARRRKFEARHSRRSARTFSRPSEGDAGRANRPGGTHFQPPVTIESTRSWR